MSLYHSFGQQLLPEMAKLRHLPPAPNKVINRTCQNRTRQPQTLQTHQKNTQRPQRARERGTWVDPRLGCSASLLGLELLEQSLAPAHGLQVVLAHSLARAPSFFGFEFLCVLNQVVALSENQFEAGRCVFMRRKDQKMLQPRRWAPGAAIAQCIADQDIPGSGLVCGPETEPMAEWRRFHSCLLCACACTSV